MRSPIVPALIAVLSLLLAGCSGLDRGLMADTVTPGRDAAVSPMPIGLWSDLWNSERRNMDLYRHLQERVPPGEAQAIIRDLIQGQQQQIRIVGQIFETNIARKGGKLNIWGYPAISAAKSAKEVAWEALEREETLVNAYEWQVAENRTGPLSAQAQRALDIQRDQIAALRRLAGTPPEPILMREAKAPVHKVKPGETLSAIAQKYQVSVLDLITANPELTGDPRPGDTLRILKPMCGPRRP